ncbi:hypothetical protein [Rhodococcus aetherivorans]|uniref:hypothetical protein n=1 Tax=Rhodococcus aetherivorans TaxID=191292 RepID=UPI001E3186FD|nr:hypothetical protein [Rhodococcus aetherivorans]UGQ39892.1 hypothetical protein LRQ66_17070 [Rhodococcus aetherivorans]
MIEQNENGESEAVEEFAGESVEESATGGLETSSRAPMESLWKDGRNPDPSRICTAHRTNGEPCRKTAIRGGNVCMTHGGAAPAVRAKARTRLEMAADRMAKELLGIATDDDAPVAVKLAAIKDALDRAGLSAKTAVSVEVGPTKEYEEILTTALTGGSRAESRAARGVEDSAVPDWLADELDTALAVDADDAPDVLDAEVVEVDDPPVPALAPEPANGMMSYEDAVAELRRTSPPPAPIGRRRRRT